MEQLKTKIRERYRANLTLLCMTSIAMYLINNNLPAKIGEGYTRSEFAYGFQIGLMIAFFVVMIIRILKMRRLANDEEKLQEMLESGQDDNQDEKPKILNMAAYVLAFVSIIAGYYGGIFFYISLGALALVSLVLGITKLIVKSKK